MTQTKNEGVTRGKFLNRQLTYEVWEGEENELGERIFARCVELNLFAGACISKEVAIHALTVVTLIRLDQLGYNHGAKNFRAEHLKLMSERGAR